MAEERSAIQAKEKREVTSRIEQTRPGPTFVPAVDIYEQGTDIILLADVPGAKAEGLDMDLNDDILTLSAKVDPPEGPDEILILKEYDTGKYYRQFTLSEQIDRSRIEADLKDGVLKLRLPKVESAAPRKIAVKAG